MKRGLVFTLCALALVASSRMAHAQLGATDVALSLNLRYTNPANPSAGGIWSLVARTGSTKGISAISAYISNITATPAITKYGNGVLSTTGSGYAGANYNANALGAILNAGNPYITTIGTAINVLYGQDTAAGTGAAPAAIVLNVGRGAAGPNNVALDPLKNVTWDNSTLIAQGTFGGSRPAFVTSGANSTGANVLPLAATTTPPANGALAATNVSGANLVVRGDGERANGVEGAGKGLWAGDANRDGVVNSSDLSLLLTNFNGTPRTWDEGNFTSTQAAPDTVVNSSDLSLLLTNFNKTSIPVSVFPAPEPSSAVLALAGCAAFFARRRVSKICVR